MADNLSILIFLFILALCSTVTGDLNLTETTSTPELMKTTIIPDLKLSKTKTIPGIDLPKTTAVPVLKLSKTKAIPDLKLSKAKAIPNLKLSKAAEVPDLKVPKTTLSTLSETAANMCGNNTAEMCDEATDTAENVTQLETSETSTKEYPVLSNVTVQLNTSKAINVTNITAPTNESKLVNETTPVNSTKTDHTINLEFLQVSEKDCHCDLYKDICDINCCCDRNCSIEDRTIFSHCIKNEEHTSSHHCLSKYTLYLNNTQYQVMEDQTGLFCIVVDNMPVRFEYSKHSALKSINDFNKQWRRHIYYDWRLEEPEITSFKLNEIYKAGTPVWILKNTSVIPLVLPIRVVSALCQGEIQVEFLKEFNSSCLRQIPQSKEECQQLDAMLHDRIISSPVLLNISGFYVQNCSEEVCLPVKTFLCLESKHSEKCTEQNITFSVFNSSAYSCDNIIRSLRYIIYHNGTQGITDVKVFVHVFNTSTKNVGTFRQHFEVSFEWLHADNKTVFQRSGHPGYLTGKPVISGIRISKTDGETENKTLDMSASPKDWLSLSIANNEGNCDLDNRVNVMFGYNVYTQCTLKVSGDCQHIQAMIWQQLIGKKMNKTDSIYISSYGDPQVDNLEDWVPLLKDIHIENSQLVTEIKIKILSTNVGTASNPQAKIIGIHLEPIYRHNVDCKNAIRSKAVSIISSVTFVDITKPPHAIFAQPPVYEIKLPKDFFYPFLSKSALKTPNFCIIFLQLVVVCLYQSFRFSLA